MPHLSRYSLLLGLCASLGACVAGTSDGPPPNQGAAGSGTAGSTGDSGSPGVGGGTTQETARERCEVSKVGPPVLRRLTQQEFQRTVLDIFPQIASGYAGVKIGTDAVSALGFSNDAGTLVVGQQTAQEILATAEDLAKRVIDDAVLPQVLPCAAAGDAACAGQFIATYGKRLFRRPLSADETQRYTDYYTSVAARSSFKLGIKWTLVSLFQSANAVYRSELGTANNGRYALSQHEIATQLAYTYGGSTPSPDLLAKADANALGTPEARLAEARNLMTTPNGQEAVRELFREWSGYPLVKARTKSMPAFTAAIAAEMARETERFIDDVVVTNKGSVRDLLTAPYTYTSPALAAFYGYGTAGADLTRVDRPTDWGIGLLAQGSMLAANAHADSTSPTWRGLMVYTKLFCNTKPKPPPQVPAIGDPVPGASTTRQRYETAHAGAPACNACHRLWDPIGFGFEHYDEIGRYRADEGGLPIDPSGYVIGSNGQKSITFTDGRDLATQLASDPAVTDCVSGLMSAYVYAGGGGVSCLAETARANLAAGKYGLIEYLAQLSTEPQFTERALAP